MLLTAPLIVLVKLRIHQSANFNKKEQNHNETTLQLSKENFTKYKTGKQELQINGKMFDIQSISIIGTDYYITGHFDEKEDLLKRALHTASNSPDNKMQFGMFIFQSFNNWIKYSFMPIEIPPLKHHISYKNCSLQSYCNNKYSPPWCSKAEMYP
jgi:hypothetical protein